MRRIHHIVAPLLVALGVLVLSPAVGALPAMDQAQIALLIKKHQEQLNLLKELAHSSNLTRAQLEESVELSRKLVEGIDYILTPMRRSQPFQAERYKSQSDTLRSMEKRLNSVAPNKDEPEQAALSPIEHSQKQLKELYEVSLRANQADEADLSQLLSEYERAKAGSIPRLSWLTLLKLWESNIRLSSQLADIHQLLARLGHFYEQESFDRQLNQDKRARQYRELFKLSPPSRSTNKSMEVTR